MTDTIDRYTRALAPPPNPYRISRFRKVLADGISLSRSLGHRPDVPMPDVVEDSAITSCIACGRFVVVDLAESDTAYGLGVVERCGFRPRHKPWGMA